MYNGGNEKIGTTQHISIYADNFDFRDTDGHDNLQIGSGEVVVNEDSEDVDFRVESKVISTHLFFCNGGNSRVGIGTGSPRSLFDNVGDTHLGNDITDVIKVTGSMEMSGGIKITDYTSAIHHENTRFWWRWKNICFK